MSIALKQFVIVCIALLCSAQYTTAQISAGFYPDSTRILIGDQLGIKLSVKQQEGSVAQFPAYKDSLGDLEILEVKPRDTTKVGTETLITQRYIVSAYDSGLYSIVPQKIYYTKGGILDSVYTDVQFIEVTTLPIDTSKPIKPIKQPLDVSINWRDYISHFLIVLAILIISLLGWWIVIRTANTSSKEEKRPKPKEPAHQWALRELQKLEQEKLWQKEDIKAYYTRLTDIMRLYLEYRFDMLAMESTTDEIRLMITRDDVSEVVQDKFLAVLKLADLVKFAKMTPHPDEHHKCLIYARDFVKATVPKETNDVNPKGKN